jgi:hypothetical protein
MDAKSRPKLRSLLIRDQIRDLTHALFSHLATNTQGYAANILFRQVRTLHRGQDHSLMISVPAIIHVKVLGLLAWHYYDRAVRFKFIQSAPKRDYAAQLGHNPVSGVGAATEQLPPAHWRVPGVPHLRQLRQMQ